LPHGRLRRLILAAAPSSSLCRIAEPTPPLRID